MPSTAVLLPWLCSSIPVAPEGGKSALNHAFPHSLDPAVLSHGKLSPPQLLYLPQSLVTTTQSS